MGQISACDDSDGAFVRINNWQTVDFSLSKESGNIADGHRRVAGYWRLTHDVSHSFVVQFANHAAFVV